jgi:hypothetical protein
MSNEAASPQQPTPCRRVAAMAEHGAEATASAAKVGRLRSKLGGIRERRIKRCFFHPITAVAFYYHTECDRMTYDSNLLFYFVTVTASPIFHPASSATPEATSST